VCERGLPAADGGDPRGLVGWLGHERDMVEHCSPHAPVAAVAMPLLTAGPADRESCGHPEDVVGDKRQRLVGERRPAELHRAGQSALVPRVEGQLVASWIEAALTAIVVDRLGAAPAGAAALPSAAAPSAASVSMRGILRMSAPAPRRNGVRWAGRRSERPCADATRPTSTLERDWLLDKMAIPDLPVPRAYRPG
jgi:hypothetical protein